MQQKTGRTKVVITSIIWLLVICSSSGYTQDKKDWEKEEKKLEHEREKDRDERDREKDKKEDEKWRERARDEREKDKKETEKRAEWAKNQREKQKHDDDKNEENYSKEAKNAPARISLSRRSTNPASSSGLPPSARRPMPDW